MEDQPSECLISDRPIIGVLAQENYDEKYSQFKSKIAASYVKALEQSGARVVPILIGQRENYYKQLLSKINGVLFPGGGVYFNKHNGYADAGRIIVNYAKETNSKGDTFPILGICLGMELFMYLEVETYNILQECNAKEVSLNLQFEEDYRQGYLYHNIPKNSLNCLEGCQTTYNFHGWCVTKELMEKYGLEEKWRVLTTSEDKDGLRFVSSLELKDSAIVGVQFHPEKNAFEWKSRSIVHTEAAVSASRWYFDWIVREARKSHHRFQSPEEEAASLIYNYNATFTNVAHQQIYYLQPTKSIWKVVFVLMLEACLFFTWPRPLNSIESVRCSTL